MKNLAYLLIVFCLTISTISCSSSSTTDAEMEALYDTYATGDDYTDEPDNDKN